MSTEISIYDPFKAGIATVATELADFISVKVPILVEGVKQKAMLPKDALAIIKPILRDNVVPVRTGIEKIRLRANEGYREQIKRNDAYAKELQAQHAKTEMPLQTAIAQIEAVQAGIEAEEREAAEAKLRAEAEAKAEAERQRVATLEAEVQHLRASLPPKTPVEVSNNVEIAQNCAISDKRLSDAQKLNQFAARLATFMEAHVPSLDAGRHRDILTNDVLPLMRRAYLLLKEAK